MFPWVSIAAARPVRPRPQRCHVPRKLTGQFDAIRAQVATHPDATLKDLRAWLRETHQVTASMTLMWETLAHLKLTLKKTLYAAEQNRPDMAAACTAACMAIGRPRRSLRVCAKMAWSLQRL